MRALLYLFVLLFSLPLQSSGTQGPNIIIIMADDMGWSDPGCYGSEIKTPALDRLAAEGVQFTRFFTVPRCSPSRASLLTGMYPQSVGMGYLDRNLGSPGYQGYLSKDYPLLPEILQQHGYNTFMAGKWHLGSGEGQLPWQRGFHSYRGLLSGASGYFSLDEGRKMAEDGHMLNNDDLGDHFYMTDDITSTALRYITQAAKSPQQPFFIYIAYTAPHTPLEAKQETIQQYLGYYDRGYAAIQKARFKRQKELGLIGAQSELKQELPQVVSKQNALMMSLYAAQITDMDKGIAQVLAKLDELQLSENTLIIFVSDNGATRETPTRHYEPYPGVKMKVSGYGANWAAVSNTPWKGYKIQTHEGGVSVPCLMRYPKLYPAAQRCEEPRHMMDLAPTILSLVGIAAPAQMQGQIIHAPAQERLLFCEHGGNRLVLSNSHKMTRQRGEKQWSLFKLEDRMELHNIAAEEPELVEKLHAAYCEWARTHQVNEGIRNYYPPAP